MKQNSIAIAAVFAATMLTAVFTTAPPFSLKDAEGQTIIQNPGRDTLPTSENRTVQLHAKSVQLLKDEKLIGDLTFNQNSLLLLVIVETKVGL